MIQQWNQHIQDTKRVSLALHLRYFRIPAMLILAVVSDAPQIRLSVSFIITHVPSCKASPWIVMDAIRTTDSFQSFYSTLGPCKLSKLQGQGVCFWEGELLKFFREMRNSVISLESCFFFSKVFVPLKIKAKQPIDVFLKSEVFKDKATVYHFPSAKVK